MREMRNSFRRHHRGVLLALAAGAVGLGLGWTPADRDGRPGPRRPQAIALLQETPAGEVVLVGNRTGTVSVIRTDDLTLLGEAPVGRNITALTPLPDGSGQPDGSGRPSGSGQIVALDHDAHELLLLRPGDGPWTAPGPFPAAAGNPLFEVEAAIPTCRYPIRAVAAGLGAGRFLSLVAEGAVPRPRRPGRGS